MKGEGAVKEANVNSDNVTFEQAPDKANVAPEVSKPPVVTLLVVPPSLVPPAPDPGGGGSGGGLSSEDLLVANTPMPQLFRNFPRSTCTIYILPLTDRWSNDHRQHL